jgi:hypothetical protein
MSFEIFQYMIYLILYKSYNNVNYAIQLENSKQSNSIPGMTLPCIGCREPEDTTHLAIK